MTTQKHPDNKSQADRRPDEVADEDAGKISKEQVTKHNMKRKDLPRGSESETRRTAQNRG